MIENSEHIAKSLVEIILNLADASDKHRAGEITANQFLTRKEMATTKLQRLIELQS